MSPVEARQIGDEIVKLPENPGAARTEKLQRTAGAAAGKLRRELQIFGGVDRFRRKASQNLRHLSLFEPCEIEPHASRSDRAQKRSRPVRDEQEYGSQRRLLDNLEKRVRSFEIEVVGGVHDTDAPAAFRRRSRKETCRQPCDVHPRFGLEPSRTRVEVALDDEEIGMSPRSGSPEYRIFGVDVQAVRCGLRARITKQKTREPVSQGCLADASRAPDEPRVMEPA